jgi:hypothetical protein
VKKSFVSLLYPKIQQHIYKGFESRADAGLRSMFVVCEFQQRNAVVAACISEDWSDDNLRQAA